MSSDRAFESVREGAGIVTDAPPEFPVRQGIDLSETNFFGRRSKSVKHASAARAGREKTNLCREKKMRGVVWLTI